MGSKAKRQESSAKATPALDAAIYNLVEQYGFDAVRAATKRQTTKRAGPKPKDDWERLGPLLIEEAYAWLDGKARLRANYQLADSIARDGPTHMRTTTHRRVMRKLSQYRKVMTFVHAVPIARANRPYRDLIRVLDAIAAAKPPLGEWAQREADTLQGQLVRYRLRIGEPDAQLTAKNIADELARPSMGGIGSGILERRLMSKR